MSEYVKPTGNADKAFHSSCPSCGAELLYSAEKKKLGCNYCGYHEEVSDATNKVVEQSLGEAVNQAKDFVPEDLGKKVLACQNCGAHFMVDAQQVNASCGFCGSLKVNTEAFKHQYIEPHGIIPFYISRTEAVRSFKRWIKQGFFHPHSLRRINAMDNLHGIYIPFWTYDAQTQSSWNGQAGYHQHENRPQSMNGRRQMQQAPQIRWKSGSGQLNHFFDDVLVVASDSLHQRYLQKILPYRTEEVVNFDPRLLVGWEAEVYNLEVDKAYHTAELVMDHRIRQMCAAQLGGDVQQNLHISSKKHSQTFKHIILPVWLCSYTYKDKVYHFTINGQTGKVSGQKPTSYFKAVLIALAFIGFLAGIWFLRYYRMNM